MKLFHIIKYKKAYWLVNQLKQEHVLDSTYKEQLNLLLNEWREKNIGCVSVLMDESYDLFMTNLGFKKVSTIVEYQRDLKHLPAIGNSISSYSLSEGEMTEQAFVELYQACCSGSANKNKLHSIEQIMKSFMNELGENWKSNCYYFKENNEVIGLSIPHIEINTVDEGRMFYFGIAPKWRKQGYGKKIHLISLSLLKRMHAFYYIGSTDEENTPMISIFKKNGCKLRGQKGIYQLGDFLNKV